MIEIGISPIVFTIGSVEIRWYGIMVALAILVIILWMVWQIKRGANLTYENIITAALVGVPSGVIIARLLHVIDNIVIAKFHPELVMTGSVIDYIQHPGWIIGGAGLTAYGAILGAALGVWAYSKFSSIKFGYIADVLAPAVVIAQAVIGRIGCTINGCCYGVEAPTWLPWSVVYTNPNSFAPLGVALHPTQPYEVIYGLIVFGVLLKLRGHLKPDGSLFLVYLSLYAIWRLGIDFIRVGMPFLLDLHQAQVVSLIVLAVAIPMLAYRARWVKTGSDE
ncbi:Phosphatidylglycerol--prolipoprotein diacylglyceryl transferase [subsurface metagenome]